MTDHPPRDYADDYLDEDDSPGGLFVLIIGGLAGMMVGSALTIAVFVARGWLA
jgi:hypothetical protein